MVQRPCHYCGAPGGTKDHVVARCWYNARHVPQIVAQSNKVPACSRCNNAKSHWRSDCECAICELAWILMAPFILPRTKSDIRVVPVVARYRGEETG